MNEIPDPADAPLPAVRDTTVTIESNTPINGKLTLQQILKDAKDLSDETLITISLGDLRRLMKFHATVESLMGRFRDAVDKVRR